MQNTLKMESDFRMMQQPNKANNANKIQVDVEKLLQWAYREELPKGYGQGEGGWNDPSSISPMFRVADLGTRVDAWSQDPGFPEALGGIPHPDALIVECVVNRLGEVGLDWKQSRERLMGHLAPYVSIDHPAMAYLSLNVSALVTIHARMGTRPQWDMGPVKIKRSNGKNGKPIVQYIDDDGYLVDGMTAGRRYGPEARCPVQLDPPGPDIAFARAEYFAWRSGLARVKATLDTWKLNQHIAVGPAAAAEPWAHDDERRSRILRVV